MDHDLDATLVAWRAGQLDGAALARRWRAAANTWPGLPPRYAAVLEHLLLPLEGAAMFTEEACAFSPADTVAGLADWLAHARRAAPPG